LEWVERFSKAKHFHLRCRAMNHLEYWLVMDANINRKPPATDFGRNETPAI
jgi:hypothetical protein